MVPDVDAQMTEYYFSGNIYGQNIYTGPMSYVRPDGIFKTAMFCGGSDVTSSTCDWSCGPTFSNCPSPGRVGSSNTMLFCPTSTTCGANCVSGSSTMLFCPTSMNCGGQTSLNCTALACGISNLGRGGIFPQQNIGGVPYPLTEYNFPENLVWVQGVAMFKPIEYKFKGFGGVMGIGGSTYYSGICGWRDVWAGTGYQDISGYTATPGW